MKNHLILILLLLLGIQQVRGQSVTSSSLSSSEYEFTPDDYSTFVKLSNQSSYRYFWNFGNGLFKLVDVPHTNSASDNTQKINHDFASTGTYKVRLEMTQIYSPPTPPDDDMEKGNSLPITIGTGNPLAPGNNVNMLGGSLIINPIREMRPGFPLTFIVTYDLNACPNSIGTLDWKFTFKYNSFMLESPTGFPAGIVEGYNGEVYNASASSFDTGTDELVVTINPPTCCSGDERHSFFLNFLVKEDVESGLPLDAIGFFGEDDPSGMTNPRPCDNFIIPDMMVAKSYDPNYKLVSEDTITTNPPQLLHYIIHFQNTGAGATDSIRIEDVLDPRLDPTTLMLTDVRIGYQHITPTDLTANPDPIFLVSTAYPWISTNPTPPFQLTEEMPTANSFIWYFSNAELRGTKEVGYGETFSELETTGSIEFDIHTCGFMEYGVIIENEAEIYFDDNAAVVTAPAQTIKYCCDLLADTLNGASFDLNKYFDPTVYPNLTSYSFTSDTASPNNRPMVMVNTVNYRCDYRPFPNGYKGLDIMTIIVCDNNTPPACDTIDIHICANVDHKAGQYPCDTTVVICTTTSISPGEVSLRPDISTFPNPTHEWLMLNYQSTKNRVEKLSLFDLHGRKLQEIPIDPSGHSRISLSGLPAGLYLLRVNEKWSKKIIKQ